MRGLITSRIWFLQVDQLRAWLADARLPHALGQIWQPVTLGKNPFDEFTRDARNPFVPFHM